ncbi:MAG: D-alanyl-D-alanine carboxypeptidase/D-alanyl-D-alanine-endopeptidase [Verrucomicrobiales bacterium]
MSARRLKRPTASPLAAIRSVLARASRLRSRHFIFAVVLLLLWLTASLHAQQNGASSPIERVRRAVESLAQSPTVATGTLGFFLASLDSPDRPLVQRLSRQSFMTASTMKVVTTGVALEVLGPEFSFETRLTWHPQTGDLVIHGAGDPTLGRDNWEPLFDEWLAGLRTLGVTEIRGRVVADESAWEPREIPDGWTWLDIGNYYAPPLSPLAFHDNEFRLWFRLLGRPGDPAGCYDADPWPDGLRLRDEVTIGEPGTGDQAYAFAAPRDFRYTLRGTLAQDAGKEFIRAALPDSALFCAQQFRWFLQTRSIPVHGAPTTSRRLDEAGTALESGPGVAVAVHRSAPLRDLLVPINHLSLNLDCECLLRTLGHGRAEAGLDTIRKHWADRKLPLAGFWQTDGSGLSRTNMITPELLSRSLASVLAGAHGADFLASLPSVGAPRSTLRRLRPASGGATIHAKSGTIERVKGYTGLVATESGRRYVFSVLVNNYDGPYEQDVGPGLQLLFEALTGLR